MDLCAALPRSRAAQGTHCRPTRPLSACLLSPHRCTLWCCAPQAHPLSIEMVLLREPPQSVSAPSPVLKPIARVVRGRPRPACLDKHFPHDHDLNMGTPGWHAWACCCLLSIVRMMGLEGGVTSPKQCSGVAKHASAARRPPYWCQWRREKSPMQAAWVARVSRGGPESPPPISRCGLHQVPSRAVMPLLCLPPPAPACMCVYVCSRLSRPWCAHVGRAADP